MPSLAVRFALFASSYAPLLYLFALLDSFGRGWPSMVCAGIATASLVVLAIMARQVRRLPLEPLAVKEARSRGADVVAFFATYVIPFAAAPEPGLADQLALLVFLLATGGLYIQQDLFYLNPILGLFGVRNYEAQKPDGTALMLLSRRRFMASGESVRAAQIGPHVYWVGGNG